MELEFTGPVFEWRGPAPYHFVAVPEDEAAIIQETAAALTYGWGMIPGTLRIGDTTWTTSLWRKAGSYVLPLTYTVRKPEGIELGDVVTISLTLDV